MVNYQIRDTANFDEQAFFDKIYWINKLSGELPETNFITDYVRPRVYTGETQNILFELPTNLSKDIIKLGNSSDLSIYLILVAVLNILLRKYTDNSDIIIGSPIYKQDNRVTNKIVALRSNVLNELTCKDFLFQVKDTVIGAYSHQNYPFDELIELLGSPKNQNRCSLFDIIILLKNIHNSDYIKNIQNDLTICFEVIENSISCKLEYNQLLFKDETIKLIIKNYIALVEIFLQKLDTPISKISFLSGEDTHQILKDFNDNTKHFPVEKTLHELFENQVKRTPNKIAAVDDKTELTYQQLNEQANQLARLIQNLGVKSGELIGILKQRDISFLVGILAILKGGGVYVPIDITYPPERVRYMLSNSEIRTLLTDSSCVNILTGSCEACQQLKDLIFLDKKPNELALDVLSNVNIYTSIDFESLPIANLQINFQGIAPAYMIYTSGSTGLPKGAIIRHGAAINHIYAQFEALQLSEDLTFIQSAPASSDISIWQFLAPILISGKTLIVNTETVCNPEKLFQVIKQRKITIAEFVPVVLISLLDYISQLAADKRLLPDLKWMMVTGELASVELVNLWLEIYPQIKVVNAYGPTEAADDITQFIIDKPLPKNQRTVPIGKPLANLNLYILDAQMQLLPIGVLGEICVSGFGVGQGYWKNPAITQRSFVPNPFADIAKPLPGTDTDFIYKTGDLGRWLADGNIEFFGRIDHQVKIRGFRIELGEIEALLSQHPSVRENVVVVRQDTPGDKRLVAYIVPTSYQEQNEVSDFSLNSNEPPINTQAILQLRQFLKERLPEYMLPSAFVLMGSLPLTPSGKVDRKALPVTDTSKSELEVSFVLPRTPTEEIVADIWADILRREQIGIYDNFFDLGGHSLLATQVISRLREAFKIDLPLRSLFENPTVKNLVEQLEGILTVQQLQAVPMQIIEDREEIEL
ncbi:non-ribosomal peptide synthetase [Nostoc sp.]|uniref:non-ribosomal peptide synthetase n=1 Tax=Nostoc sp. TaxID=1180 RepID=UPI002FFCD60F